MTESDRIRHLTDEQVYELASGETVDPGVHAHAAGCGPCRARVEGTRRLLGAIEALDPGVAPPAKLELELARRLRAGRTGSGLPWRRAVAGVAAAVVCFVAGAASHAVWFGPGAGTSSSPVSDAPTPALAIQRAGTEYVAAIASFADGIERTTDRDRRTGREVALAAMSGAAFELRRLDDSSVETSEIRRLVDDAWRRTAGEEAP